MSLVEEEAESVAESFKRNGSCGSIRSGKGKFIIIFSDDGDEFFEICKEVLHKSPYEREKRVKLKPHIRNEVEIVPRLKANMESSMCL